AELWPLRPIVPVVALGGLLLTFSPRFVAWSQGYMALLCLAVGFVLFERAVPRPLGFAGLMLFSSATYTLFKLRLLPATLVAGSVVVACELKSAFLLHNFPGLLAAPTIGIVTANLFGMLAGYAMEQSARRDFLLLRLLEGERRAVEAERQRSERL